MTSPVFFPARVINDHRGSFVKQNIQVLGDQFIVQDLFQTRSDKNVLRGIHWQSAPCATDRLVSVQSGEIFDVTIDLRPNSLEFGKIQIWNLSEDTPGYLYIPKHFGHGYQVLSSSSLISYLTNGKYCEKHDSGILWSSLNVNWPNVEAIVSRRDSEFPPFIDAFLQ